MYIEEELEDLPSKKMTDEEIELAAQKHMDSLVDGYFDNILLEVIKENFVFTDEDFCGDIRLESRIFIGTVMSLYPSGKYYLPFACSNVTEDEAAIDEAFWEKFDSELSDRGLYTMPSEWCPTDVFACAEIPIDSIYADMLDDLNADPQSEDYESALFFMETIFDEGQLNGDRFDDLMDKIKSHHGAQEYLNKKCVAYLQKAKEDNA